MSICYVFRFFVLSYVDLTLDTVWRPNLFPPKQIKVILTLKHNMSHTCIMCSALSNIDLFFGPTLSYWCHFAKCISVKNYFNIITHGPGKVKFSKMSNYKQAAEFLKEARKHDQKGKLQEALHFYEQGVESLLQVIKSKYCYDFLLHKPFCSAIQFTIRFFFFLDENSSQIFKKELRIKCDKYLERAEAIQLFLATVPELWKVTVYQPLVCKPLASQFQRKFLRQTTQSS